MKNYYLVNNGRLKREQNTLIVETAAGEKKPIPVEDVDSLYLYGEVDLNTKLLNFLSQKRVPLHVFNYYGFYSGSYYPREYLHSGYALVQQVRHYTDETCRMTIAREIVRASAHSLQRVVAYYERRGAGDSAQEDREPTGEIGIEQGDPVLDEGLEAAVDSALDAPAEGSPAEDGSSDSLGADVDLPEEAESLEQLQARLKGLSAQIDRQARVNDLRGLEGKMRERYYQAWRHILGADWAFTRRMRRPPGNEVNALISFGNSVLYTACLSEIYRTQLTPTISYLHEPGARRFSLALDLSEIFKPLIVDRAIFRLLNSGQMKPSHFDKSMEGCLLTDSGRRLFLAALEERLGTTIRHRRLGRHVSYRHLLRLECYKLIRHLTGVEPYRGFRAWW